MGNRLEVFKTNKKRSVTHFYFPHYTLLFGFHHLHHALTSTCFLHAHNKPDASFLKGQGYQGVFSFEKGTSML